MEPSLDGFRVLASAGHRSVGDAFLARFVAYEQQVLLHLLPLDTERTLHTPLDATGRQLHALDHPALPRVLATGRDEARQFSWLAMAPPDGCSASDLLHVAGRPPADAIPAIAQAVGDALVAARRGGVRVTSPPGLDSVFLASSSPDDPWRDLRVVLTDWATAKLEPMPAPLDEASGAAADEAEGQSQTDALVHAFLRELSEAADRVDDARREVHPVNWRPLAGLSLGGFRLIDTMASTDDRVTFRASSEADDGEVAVHVRELSSAPGDSIDVLRRVQEHISPHPSLAPALTFGVDHVRNIQWFATEFRSDWIPLSSWLAAHRQPPIEAWTHVRAGFEAALEALSAQGVGLSSPPSAASLFVHAPLNDPNRTPLEIVFADWANVFVVHEPSSRRSADDAPPEHSAAARAAGATTEAQLAPVERRALGRQELVAALWAELEAYTGGLRVTDRSGGDLEGGWVSRIAKGPLVEVPADSSPTATTLVAADTPSISERAADSLGELLLQERVLTHAQLAAALREQAATGQRLDLTLVRLGMVPEVTVLEVLSRLLRIPTVDLSRIDVDPQALRLISAKMARRYAVFPLKRHGRQLTLAIADPTNLDVLNVLDGLSALTRHIIIPVLAGESQIRIAIEQYYDFGDAKKPPALGPLVLPQSRREATYAPALLADELDSMSLASGPVHDDDVQFTCYCPDRIAPERFCDVLVFAHKSTPISLDGGPLTDPTSMVEEQAGRLLGDQREAYRTTIQESSASIPHAAVLTFALELPQGITGNPLRQSVQWLEPIHRVHFRVRADASLAGTTTRGRVLVYQGALAVAEITLRFTIASTTEPIPVPAAATPVVARRYRRIFASYSREDAAIVEQFSAYAAATGDRYLQDVVSLRAGERWGEGLQRLIREADVFQLFWSSRAMVSPFVRREWEFALSLKREGFIRPCYWEDPLPQRLPDLPPPPLRVLHFHALGIPQVRRRKLERTSLRATAPKDSAHAARAAPKHPPPPVFVESRLPAPRASAPSEYTQMFRVAPPPPQPTSAPEAENPSPKAPHHSPTRGVRIVVFLAALVVLLTLALVFWANRS